MRANPPREPEAGSRPSDPELRPADPPGRNRFTFAAWLFLRLLALVHFVAFASFWLQLEGLIGPRGLLPAGRYFDAVREQIGGRAFYELPSLCWIFGTQGFLHVLCAAGVLLSLLAFAGIAPAACLALLWAAYLSLNGAGQIFFNFQWDALLLETTLLAVFVAPWKLLPLWRPHEPPTPARLLLWWLLFRLMFFAGVVKLASGDPLWSSLTALTVHYETQPLPTPLAWYLHQAPAWWHRASCVGMFVIELAAPFLLFTSRPLRHNAAGLLAALMFAVALSGNYTFFNLLALALCLACFDDAAWRTLLPSRWLRHFHVLRENGARPPPDRAIGEFHVIRESRRGLSSEPGIDFHVIRENGPKRRGWRQRLAWLGAGAVFAYTAAQSLPVLFPKLGAPPGYRAAAAVVGPLRSFNNYGLFAVMTNPRPELIFEGSDDGRTWQAYEFPHKPGALERRPTWVAPHQPRLDWQLWFAALGTRDRNPWVLALCEHLLRGTPQVLGLLAHNPFPEKPPRHIRVVRYEYHFTDPATRARTGQWWRRTPLDFYVPPASLR